MTDPRGIKWLDPWIPEPDEDGLLAKELRREVCDCHILLGVNTRADGTRIDCDDVLFVTDDPRKPIAVVHLTWKFETDPTWPVTSIFNGWQDWIENCMMKDHSDYTNCE
ncbi:hypothetical protein KOR42_24970 [Thalassoglobus neptunius]|uniref:Uncharacterized protein n=1 Tax=Thalassoglobus neptunius TaxID=1938619 RepID=A0A5C5X8E2_9PLAN|nr:hypothetical protein [Thalassoglobus neptunius]TWT59108.1 hypothetical protein KOR42_24970 [Thalassoglobus neptunius]